MIVCGSSPERDPRLAVYSYNLENHITSKSLTGFACRVDFLSRNLKPLSPRTDFRMRQWLASNIIQIEVEWLIERDWVN